MIVNETKKILSKYQIYAKKMYGQNFLVSQNVLDSILTNSRIEKETGVIEIGPGIGTLTEVLAINAKKVLSYEIDEDMISILNDTLSNYQNVIIENIDFLKADIKSDISKHFAGFDRIVVVANLPYYITTPIIFKLLEDTDIKEFLFMVQKEVGKRLTGKPNTKDYNALSVLMKYKTISRIVDNVPRNSFLPEPNVDSVLLRIETIKNDYNVNNEGKFLKFIRNIFIQRRKTMVNNLVVAYNLNKSEVSGILVKMGYNSNIRSEALDLEDIVKIYKTIFE
jgi:16S rRNA (adenine1518-N6/adenine1519-N6)-dimethyltransferase